MAELALAVLPLVISALEHYSSVSRTISRYRKFSDKADEFFAELDVQCKIFQISVQLLLASEVGDEQAVRMLQDENDSGWKDAALDAFLSDRFSGGYASAATNCLELIRRQISKLLEVSESFKYVAAQVEEDGRLSLNKKAHRIGKKIDIVCSKGRIAESLNSLKGRAQDFRILVEQTERLAERRPPQEPNRFAKARVERFKAVEAAANNLYAAFGQACTKHTEHQAILASNQRTMTLAMSTSAETHVCWLNIESMITARIRPIETTGVLESMNKTAKRVLDAPPEDSERRIDATQKAKKQKKAVSSQAVPLLDCRLTRSPCSSGGIHSLDTLVNLCSHNNFCNQIQKVLMQSKLPADSCIGYLETSDSSKHLVYVHSRMQKVTSGTRRVEMRALSELLKDAARSMQLHDFLADHKRIHIGKQLALALLQFHETCWLKESWSSDDIVVSGAAKDEGSDSLHSNEPAEESYANVSIHQQAIAARPPQPKPMP
ncbi:hypothetical protein CLAIMM_07032 [Cladophialophora immunda]|nr:hypothetical protein CLAIMM_07032 [Cladophialophora immunda]